MQETWMNVTGDEWQQLLDGAIVVIRPALLDVKVDDDWWVFCPDIPEMWIKVQAVRQNGQSTSIRRCSK
jgi:hypothetical protein